MGAIPWGLILQVGLKLIDLFLARSAKKEAMKRQMFEFIRQYDSGVMDNVKLKSQYDELLKKMYHDRKK